MSFETTPPNANPESGFLFNMITCSVGVATSLIKAAGSLSVLNAITFQGSVEVIYYAALGGVVSLLAKNSVVKFVKLFRQPSSEE